MTSAEGALPLAPWQEIVGRKKSLQADLLAAGLASLDEATETSDSDIDVTSISNARRFVDLILQGDLTCKSATKAFIKRF